MHIVETISELRQALQTWRQAGQGIALVPTMGNLHAGHISLVHAARAAAPRVVVSIFVNPTQFGPGEDYASYPRTLAADTQQLELSGVDLLFLPSNEVLYTPNACTRVTVEGLSDRYCGASRPGHFSGVATIVTKLFNLVQPDLAIFGEKDFQQLAVIRQMVQDLNIPVTLQGVATVREADGLALSSRNSYLTSVERGVAPLLYQVLCAAKMCIMGGERDYAKVAAEGRKTLEKVGFLLDYLAVCNAIDLQAAQARDNNLVILAAAKLGKPRLIDNIRVQLESTVSA